MFAKIKRQMRKEIKLEGNIYLKFEAIFKGNMYENVIAFIYF